MLQFLAGLGAVVVGAALLWEQGAFEDVWHPFAARNRLAFVALLLVAAGVVCMIDVLAAG